MPDFGAFDKSSHFLYYLTLHNLSSLQQPIELEFLNCTNSENPVLIRAAEKESQRRRFAPEPQGSGFSL